MSEVMNKYKSFLFQYFTSAILISIIGLIISLYLEETCGRSVTIKGRIIIDFIKAISMAILVAGVFSWISSTERFIKRIQSILESILIDMKFLAYLDDRKKANIMKSLFRSEASIEVVPNIDEYYNFYIDHILRVAHETVRTNYIVNTKVWYDSSIDKMVCEKRHHYRIYRNEKGFYDDIIMGVIPSDICFELSDFVISNDNEILEEIKKPVTVEKDLEGEKAKIATIKLGQYQAEKVLNIDYVNREYGFDHWYTAAIQILKPTYGLTYRILCEKDTVVKTIDTFSQGACFTIKQNGNETVITANQWLNPGAGVSVIVAKDVHHSQKSGTPES
jgi:hypothetical protein